jgi:hypothetical protein
MDGFHVKGMAEGEVDFFSATQIKKPIPGKHALHAYHQPFLERRDNFEKFFGATVDVAMEQDVTFPIKDTDVHFLGMKVDSAVMFV